MAKQHHMSRKELREDAIQDAGVSFLHWAKENYHRVLTPALAVILLVVIALAVRSYVSGKSVKASALVFEAQDKVRVALTLTDATQRSESLDAAVVLFEKAAEDFAGTSVATEALYLKGNALALNQDFEGAVTSYRAFMKEAAEPEAAARALVGIGFALENEAFLNPAEEEDLLSEAAGFYNRAVEAASRDREKPLFQAMQAKVGLARLAEHSGDLEGAIALYEEIAEERVYMDEDVEPADQQQWAQWANLDQQEKARMVRSQWLALETSAMFEQVAESAIERLTRLQKEEARATQ